MKHMTVRQALQHAADNPGQVSDDLLQKPVYELIARNLFELANTPDADVRGSMARANRARGILLNRLVGRRKAGSHPATRGHQAIEFVDLTAPPREPEEDDSEPASDTAE